MNDSVTGEAGTLFSPVCLLGVEKWRSSVYRAEGYIFIRLTRLEYNMLRGLHIPTLFCLAFLVLLSGCYNKSIRHLASDASLIKAGSSSRNDVLTYLGEPDAQRVLENGREEWVYVEEKPSDFQRAPVVGGFFGGKGYDKVFIVLENDIVKSCQFREFADDEFDWDDESSWFFW